MRMDAGPDTGLMPLRRPEQIAADDNSPAACTTARPGWAQM